MHTPRVHHHRRRRHHILMHARTRARSGLWDLHRLHRDVAIQWFEQRRAVDGIESSTQKRRSKARGSPFPSEEDMWGPAPGARRRRGGADGEEGDGEGVVDGDDLLQGLAGQARVSAARPSKAAWGMYQSAAGATVQQQAAPVCLASGRALEKRVCWSVDFLCLPLPRFAFALSRRYGHWALLTPAPTRTPAPTLTPATTTACHCTHRTPRLRRRRCGSTR